MNIVRIEVLTGRPSSDTVYIHTDLPSPMFEGGDGHVMKLEVSKGKGLEYVVANFVGYSIVEIDTQDGVVRNIK